MKELYRIALAGNPNCGKTTIFNALTGTRQHVGNYPGVTVERKCGSCRIGNVNIEIIDLPGIYSLSSSSPEEKVAIRELLKTPIDLIMNVVDAGNLQRNLYLSTQLAELNIPMLLVFNMIDDARDRGFVFDLPKFERYLGAPIVETIGSKEEGIDQLKALTAKLLVGEAQKPATIRYGEHIDQAINSLAAAVEDKQEFTTPPIPPRYFAIKLLENDPEICSLPAFAPLLPMAEELRERLSVRHGVSSTTLMADCRYGVIAGACREAITLNNEQHRQISDSIDKVVTNRYLGLPIFLLIMLAVFAFTFIFSEPLVGVVAFLLDRVSALIDSAWPATALPYLKALVLEGVIGGVGGVLMFIPNILLLFLAIAFLEGTGYMARAAFVMDGFMHKFGLHGKSFIPMLLGFGCTVPAVMATRTIESERDRLTTILILPLMSCSARLPIYSLLIPIFFPLRLQPVIMWTIYLIGASLALGGAAILKATIFKGEDEVFVMELPPYRMPTLKSLLIHMGERAMLYLHKAGTIILGASIVLFFINTLPQKKNYDRDYKALAEAINDNMAMSQDEKKQAMDELVSQHQTEKLNYSIAGRIGKKIAVPMRYAGFDWKASSALIGAFAAKELFVSQLAILHSVGQGEDAAQALRQKLRDSYNPLQAFCLMLFCLISMPCIGTVAVVYKETLSWKITLGQLAGLTTLAYVITTIVYQVGRALNIGLS
ncbi:MAG: ferrous iron transport protein B [Lentisphaerae bacterium]|nr:ferrous iron transport protein B [Lentisphaerota bacterium]